MFPMKLKLWLPFLAAVTLAGCGGSKQDAQKVAPAGPVPDIYKVTFDTSRGPFVIEVHKDWAPEGAERFYRLVEQKYYDGNRFFRVVPNFVVQWGIHGNPQMSAVWRNLVIKDDPVKESNKRGYVTYATSGPNTRTTQVFVNLRENARLDKLGFSPFGRVVSGLDEVVDKLYSAYRDGPPNGSGPDQNQIELRGNAYLEERFPRLDYIKSARITEPRP